MWWPNFRQVCSLVDLLEAEKLTVLKIDSALPENANETRLRSSLLPGEYGDIIITVETWTDFLETDIKANHILKAVTPIPDFVEKFEGELEKKIRLPRGVRVSLDSYVCFSFLM